MSQTSFAGQPNLPAFVQPAQGKNLYAGNYLNFLDGSVEQWAQQFLPDVYDKEVEIYGNRTISGFLKMVSAEMPSTSDQIIWLEQGRLHTRYTGATVTAGTITNAGTAITFAATASVILDQDVLMVLVGLVLLLKELTTMHSTSVLDKLL